VGLSIFAVASRPTLGTICPPIQWVSGALTPGVSRPGREADHSPHLVPRLRMPRAVLQLPQYVFMAWCLVVPREKFTFTYSCNGIMRGWGIMHAQRKREMYTIFWKEILRLMNRCWKNVIKLGLWDRRGVQVS
jgi:hypothetical protein